MSDNATLPSPAELRARSEAAVVLIHARTAAQDCQGRAGEDAAAYVLRAVERAMGVSR